MPTALTGLTGAFFPTSVFFETGFGTAFFLITLVFLATVFLGTDLADGFGLTGDLLLEADFTGDLLLEADLTGVFDFSLIGAAEALAAAFVTLSASFCSALTSRFLAGTTACGGFVTLTPTTLRSGFAEDTLPVSLTGDFERDLEDLGVTFESAGLFANADFPSAFAVLERTAA